MLSAIDRVRRPARSGIAPARAGRRASGNPDGVRVRQADDDLVAESYVDAEQARRMAIRWLQRSRGSVELFHPTPPSENDRYGRRRRI